MQIKNFLEDLISKVYDFPIKKQIWKFKLSMNLSHKLPIYMEAFPTYSQNLWRIVKDIKDYWIDVKCIDVWANIWDSIAIIKNYCDVPVLWIEWDQKYLNHLDKNLKILWNNIEVEKSFIWIGIWSKLERKWWTTRIDVVWKENGNIKMKSLEEILELHKNFGNFNFIKIDTDGFDTKIIKSSIDIIKKNKPTIFFEYDPYFLEMQNEKWIDIFSLLKNLSYQYMIIYDNIWQYITSCSLDNEKLIEDLHRYVLGRKSEFYYDICVFNDLNTFNYVNEEEKKFFNKLKNL